MITLVLSILLAYLIGSFCSAILVCRLFGLPDPRTQGSHNPGATNVKRIGGLKPAVITLILDFLKGLVVLESARILAPGILAIHLALLYLFVILGHCYSIFYGFQGGKGIATGLGGIFGLFGISSWISWGSLGLWVLLFLIFRVSAISGLGVFLVMPVIAIWVFGLLPGLFILLASGIIFLRHYENIIQLKNYYLGNS